MVEKRRHGNFNHALPRIWAVQVTKLMHPGDWKDAHAFQARSLRYNNPLRLERESNSATIMINEEEVH
jgi:hypothetical protein